MEENKQEPNENTNCTDTIKNLVMKELSQFTTNELDTNELDILIKLVDIYKDLENIDY